MGLTAHISGRSGSCVRNLLFTERIRGYEDCWNHRQRDCAVCSDVPVNGVAIHVDLELRGGVSRDRDEADWVLGGILADAVCVTVCRRVEIVSFEKCVADNDRFHLAAGEDL